MDLKSLPQEILPTIFKFLPLEDRKNVRLTCQLWNFACNRPVIIAHEKFVFRLGYSRDDMTQLGIAINNCQVLRTEFEFHMLALKDLPTSCWEHCGHQIKSLFIHECLVTEKTITNIISHCFNLSTFHLQMHSKGGRDLTFASEKELTLDGLVRSKVERKNLLSFNFFVNAKIDMENLFQVFPNIRTLGMGSICTKNSKCYYSPLLSTVIQPSWSCLPSTLENLKYTNLIRASIIFAPFPSSNFIRLKEMRVDVALDVPIESVRQFFLHQNQLRKLQLRIKGGNAGDVKTLLFLILKNSPELVDLGFHSRHGIRFALTEFDHFLSEIKRLESLNLIFIKFFLERRLEWVASPQFPSAEYLRLKKLCLECDRMHVDFDRVTRKILNRCQTLQFLRLKFVADDTLRKILHYHTELKTLQIFLAHNDGFEPQAGQHSFSFNRLRSLEYLTIHGDRTKNVLTEFDFPKLKYFEISSWPTQVMYTLIDNLSLEAPSLEILRVNSKFLYSPVTINYFKRWKYLRFIKFTRFHLEGYSLSQMFIDCPSLTYIVDSRRAFYYDRFSKNLEWYNVGSQFSPPIYHKHNIYDIHL